jgi:hypothetical protein
MGSQINGKTLDIWIAVILTESKSIKECRKLSRTVICTSEEARHLNI